MSDRAAKSLVVLISVLVALTGCELFLRWMDLRYTPLRIETVRAWTEWRYFHAFADKHFVYDPVLIWRPRKGMAPFNSHGFRGRETTVDKKPGTLRIIALGDSNTLGWLGEEGNWPAALEAILVKRYPCTEMVNAGVYGYSSFQGVARFRELLPFMPDVVLVSFGLNDAARVTIADAEFVSRRVRTLGLDQALIKLRLGQMLLGVVDRLLRRDERHLVRRASLQEYAANLHEIVRLALERDIRVVLLTRPVTGESSGPVWNDNFDPDYNAMLLWVARELNVPFIDVYAHFKDKEQYFADETHFTREGHLTMAHLVAERIEPLLSIPTRPVCRSDGV